MQYVRQMSTPVSEFNAGVIYVGVKLFTDVAGMGNHASNVGLLWMPAVT